MEFFTSLKENSPKFIINGDFLVNEESSNEDEELFGSETKTPQVI